MIVQTKLIAAVWLHGGEARLVTESYIARKLTVGCLWAAVIALTILLAHRRYNVGNGIGADFKIWLQAARDVAARRSPWRPSPLGLFLYPPTIPLLLAPFAHAAEPVRLWHVWTGLEIAAFVAGVVAFVRNVAPRLRTWQRPLVFGFCSVTVLHFWPVTLALYYGQSDAFVFAVLLWAGFASSRARATAFGILIGVAGLLKGWPAMLAVVLRQRGLGGRRRAVKAFVVTILLAPIMIVVVGGVSGVTGFLQNNADARNQDLVSASVWGAPKLLFSHTGFARPLFVSSGVRLAVTAMLLAWVLGLLVTALRTPGDPSLCMWNVMLCVVLLLPISHLWYTLYALPLLWIWGCRALERAPKWDSGEIAVVAVLVVWWIVQYKRRTNQDLGPDPTLLSSARYCVVFGANLIACTVSVIGARTVMGPTRNEGGVRRGSAFTTERRPLSQK